MRTGGASDESGRSAGSIIPVSWAAMARTSSVVRRGRQLGTESCGSASAAGGADGADPPVERGESEDRSTAPNMLMVRVLPGRCPICARRRPGDAENGQIAKAWL